MYATIYSISAGTTINPMAPETNDYFNVEQVAYICKPVGGKNPVCFTSYGRLNEMEIGGRAIRDRDGKMFDIIGARDFKTGDTIGEVPNKKIAHHVFK